VGAVFCVGTSANGASPVAAEAPPANDNKPAAPNSGTAFVPLFRFGVCFASDIVKFSHFRYCGVVKRFERKVAQMNAR
jgi:hypothetical protein